MTEGIDFIIENLLNEMDNDSNIEFDKLHNLIALKSNSEKHKAYLYNDIKTWLNLYLLSIKNKKFSYDTIIHEKINEKIKLVPLKQQISLINYFLRLLKKDFFLEEASYYENYKNALEIQEAKNKNIFVYLIKKSTQNFTSVLISFFISIVVISIFWCIIESPYLQLISTNTIEYSKCNLINYPLNLLNVIFNQADIKPDTIKELLFIIIIKFYFFIIITYFVIKEIAKKVESI